MRALGLTGIALAFLGLGLSEFTNTSWWISVPMMLLGCLLIVAVVMADNPNEEKETP